MSEPSGGCLLPLALPEQRTERALLVAVRRMAAHGVRDVSAAWLMIDLLSTGFRRPLVLLRAFMLELAHASHRQIRLAPCCALRMTRDEGLILDTLRLAALDPDAAEHALATLTNNRQVFEPLSAAIVFGRALADEAHAGGAAPGPARTRLSSHDIDQRKPSGA